jgi:hypothetical protein
MSPTRFSRGWLAGVLRHLVFFVGQNPYYYMAMSAILRKWAD